MTNPISVGRIFLVILFAGTFLMACKKPCKDVICDNNGTPNEDGKECICTCVENDAGVVDYEGERCDLLVRDKFIDTWLGNSVCGGGNFQHYLRITSGDSTHQVDIANMGDYGFDHVVVASINTSNTLTITDQLAGGKRFSGDGTLENNVLTFNYTVSQNGTVQTCTATFNMID